MEGGRRGELRRTMTLSEQLASPDPEIRNFLKIPQNADGDESHHAAPMDAAGDDPDAADADGGINWKPLKDRLLLRRAGSAWPAPSSSSSATADDADDGNAEPSAPAFSRSMSRAVSIRPGPGGAAFSRATSVRPRSAAATNTVEEEEEGGAPVTQMSLMALLEQTDSQWEEEGGGMEEEEEEAGEEEEGSEEMVHVCCVCMVRHKGAAFIPCGHTFCRLCSRELWVSRGNCPLCNGFIQEILDIF